MRKVTIASIIVILIFNLIVSRNVYADYPSVIDNSIEQENLTQMEEAIDPGITNSLADEGETTIHKGSSNNDGTYSINDETTTTKSTISSSGSGAGIVAGIINIFPTTISAIMTILVTTQQPSTSTIKEFTIQDLVNYLDSLILENQTNINILDSILKSTELEETDIASILNKFDMKYNIKFIKDILTDSL